MSTPQDLQQYRRLSGALRQIGQLFLNELPAATVSLHLYSSEGATRLDAYDRMGKLIAKLPTFQTSRALRDAIDRLAAEKCPDPDGIVAPL
jgi:hypothetical protein